MKRFIQLHLLSFYPSSNLNRDDLGRPKTAQIGGTNRLRISSQSLKRAWRTSDLFIDSLTGNIGRRTKNMGIEIYNKLVEGDLEKKKAIKYGRIIAEVFGKSKGEDKTKKDENKNILQELEIEQLAHFTPEEENAINALVKKIVETKEEPSKEDLNLLIKKHTASDVAMFGRMLAGAPDFNTDAAVQVAHAITINKVQMEDDFFTAVDDINLGEDSGAGHMGSTEFGAGVFYLYICIDRGLLLENLSNDKVIYEKTMRALVDCATQISPTGKQNSFASRSRASYVLAEKGNQQPRTLASAFIKPISGEDQLKKGIEELKRTRTNMDNAYGDCADDIKEMDVEAGEGKLNDILSFVAED